MNVDKKKIDNLNIFDRTDDVIKTKKISKKEIERQEILFKELVDRFEGLSRDKQMELLNYIKGEVNLSKNKMFEQIDGLSIENRENLQDEFEDILFSDFEKDDVYKRSRKK